VRAARPPARHAKLTEELPGLDPPQLLEASVGEFLPHVGVPGQDREQLRGRLALLDRSEWTKSTVPANRSGRVVSQVASRFMSSTSWGGK
jgi:hypothetical protein